ncbi:MAG: phage holin family protein [Clostridiales bacterium]|nr:phage holin family protein [Clostridiales bacterium]
MRSFMWRVIINGLALILVAKLLGGVQVSGVFSAFIAALVLGVLNAVIRPLLLLFSLPLNIMTLGLFTLVVNGLVLWMVTAFVKGFSISNFWLTIVSAILLAAISGLLSWLIGKPDKK